MYLVLQQLAEVVLMLGFKLVAIFDYKKSISINFNMCTRLQLPSLSISTFLQDSTSSQNSTPSTSSKDSIFSQDSTSSKGSTIRKLTREKYNEIAKKKLLESIAKTINAEILERTKQAAEKAAEQAKQAAEKAAKHSIQKHNKALDDIKHILSKFDILHRYHLSVENMYELLSKGKNFNEMRDLIKKWMKSYLGKIISEFKKSEINSIFSRCQKVEEYHNLYNILSTIIYLPNLENYIKKLVAYSPDKKLNLTYDYKKKLSKEILKTDKIQHAYQLIMPYTDLCLIDPCLRDPRLRDPRRRDKTILDFYITVEDLKNECLKNIEKTLMDIDNRGRRRDQMYNNSSYRRDRSRSRDNI
jgi:hypothetical protein